MTKKVGIFDSGVGGITVLREALMLAPELEYVYYTDNLNVPYGTKTKEQVKGYVQHIIDVMMAEKVDAIVIACNTATCITVKDLRARYSIPIIGMEPAVKPAIEGSPKGKIIVTATPLTLTTEKFHNLVAKVDMEHRTLPLPLPELVTIAEHKEFSKDKIYEYFKQKLAPYNLEEVSGIVLGCTHFVYFRKYLENMLPKHITIYDGNEGTIRHLKECLNINNGINEAASLDINSIDDSKITFYYSDKKCENLDILKGYLACI